MRPLAKGRLRTGVRWAGALALAILSGCAFEGGGDVTNPVARNLSWFSYLNAQDIRDRCVEGAPNRYRLVLNAGYGVHVRTYDLIGREDGGEALMRVFGETVQGGRFQLDDLFGPWRGQIHRGDVAPESLDRLREALAADGALERPPVGKQLASDSVYWVADLCLDGRFHYHAWEAGPGDRQLAFPDVLRTIDRTGVAWPDPGILDRYPYNLSPDDDDPDPRFNVGVTDRGIASDALAIR